MRLVICKKRRREDAFSPEFSYLLSYSRTQAQEVFGAAELMIFDEQTQVPDLGQADYVLLFGEGNVFLTGTTLQLLKQAIEQGAEGAVPTRLTSFPLSESDSPYTVRGFQQLEQRLLQQTPGNDARPASHLPVSLFSGEAFRRLLARESLASLLSDPQAVSGRNQWLPLHNAGIYHEFVDYYGECREDILPFLPSSAREVLEIGCGRGLTGKLIQERLGCRVTGVELNPEVAREATQHLWRVLIGDVQTLAIDGRYDAVVATELFEHLNYPELFLSKMKSLLNPGGRIVLSTPNVGHYAIVEDLLAGRWDYVPIGILCYTHFRFFTRATLEDWLSGAGFRDLQIIPQLTELPERFRQLPAAFELDGESLSTKGFYITLDL